MIDLDAIRVFARVADLGSFTRAAEQLGIAKGRVSAIVSRIEADLGARLLERTTRSVRLTLEGERFLARGRELLIDAEELAALFAPAKGDLTGRLRIDLPYVIAREVVIPRLPDFSRAHPRLELAVSTTDRRVDLVHEGFDCAMVVGDLPDSDLVVRRLGEMRMINAASPAYLKTYGLPETTADLSAHRVVHYAPDLSSREAGWSRRLPDGSFTRLPMSASLTVNGFDAYQAAAVAGFGLIQAPEVGLRRLVEAGALVPVLTEDVAPPIPVSLLYPGRKRLAPRIIAILDWLASVMETPDALG